MFMKYSNPIIKVEQEASGNRLLTKALNTVYVWSQSHSAITHPDQAERVSNRQTIAIRPLFYLYSITLTT